MLDSKASSVTIRTRAKGLLGKLAHDLEIQAEGFSADVAVDGETWRAELSFPVASLRVVGAVKNGSVDHSVLSNKDISDIQQKIRGEVLLGAEVKVSAKGSRTRAELVVNAPRGEQSLSCSMSKDDKDGVVVAYGKTTLSLKRLGVKEIKGPLGAFRVDDAVEVAFFIQLAGAQAPA